MLLCLLLLHLRLRDVVLSVALLGTEPAFFVLLSVFQLVSLKLRKDQLELREISRSKGKHQVNLELGKMGLGLIILKFILVEEVMGLEVLRPVGALQKSPY